MITSIASTSTETGGLLAEAMERMRRYDLEHVPVVAGPDNDEPVGVLDSRSANRKISAEVLNSRRTAGEAALAAC